MAYQETKTTSYGSRLSNSIKGIGTGFIMLLAGTALLWWNEGRAVKTTRMLEEAEGVAVHVEDVSAVASDLDGKLIHATAFTKTKDILSDPTFGIKENAVKLNREVEYYQWVENTTTETKDKIGGGQEEITTYTYEQKWVSSPVNSQKFKDKAYRNKNFAVMNIKSEDRMAENVTFGAYKLPKSLIHSIRGSKPVELDFDKETLSKWNNDFKIASRDLQAQLEGIGDNIAKGIEKVITKDSTATAEEVKQDTTNTDLDYIHVNENVLYYGKNPNMPAVGDMRITFTKVLPGEVSIIAQVNGDRLQSYTAKNGKTLSVLRMGAEDMGAMFQSEHKGNTIMTWIWRIVGLLLVIGGFKGIFNILITILKVLPFLADIAGLGVGLVCNIIGLAWSLIIIAIAWLFYRPLIGIGLIAVIVGLIVYLSKRGKSAKNSAPQPTA